MAYVRERQALLRFYQGGYTAICLYTLDELATCFFIGGLFIVENISRKFVMITSIVLDLKYQKS